MPSLSDAPTAVSVCASCSPGLRCGRSSSVRSSLGPVPAVPLLGGLGWVGRAWHVLLVLRSHQLLTSRSFLLAFPAALSLHACARVALGAALRPLTSPFPVTVLGTALADGGSDTCCWALFCAPLRASVPHFLSELGVTRLMASNHNTAVLGAAMVLPFPTTYRGCDVSKSEPAFLHGTGGAGSDVWATGCFEVTFLCGVSVCPPPFVCLDGQLSRHRWWERLCLPLCMGALAGDTPTGRGLVSVLDSVPLVSDRASVLVPGPRESEAQLRASSRAGV